MTREQHQQLSQTMAFVDRRLADPDFLVRYAGYGPMALWKELRVLFVQLFETLESESHAPVGSDVSQQPPA